MGLQAGARETGGRRGDGSDSGPDQVSPVCDYCKRSCRLSSLETELGGRRGQQGGKQEEEMGGEAGKGYGKGKEGTVSCQSKRARAQKARKNSFIR